MESGINRQRGRPRSNTQKGQASSIQAVDRALNILRIVARGGGLSLTEIATAAETPAASAYRILVTLEKNGMVIFNEDDQLWFVGLEAFRIGAAFLVRTSLLEQSRPVMQRLMAGTGETVNLAVRDNAQVIFVSQVETHQLIRAFFRPGTHGTVHASGVGKALLAFSTHEVQENIVSSLKLEAFTPKTLSTRDQLMQDLAAIRSRGFAVDDEERTQGMRCIAAPIFDQYGEPVAGISISGPSIRISSEKDDLNGSQVRAAADEISLAIGGQIPTE